MQTQIKPSSFRSASFIPAALAAVLTLADADFGFANTYHLTVEE